MLLALAQWLQNDASFLRVFIYITFRAVMATATALLIGLVCGPWVIRQLTAMKIGQAGAQGRRRRRTSSSPARRRWAAC